MTIIVFLIDTSASMNQRAYLGGRPTLLDVAKGAVETFVKVRAVSSTLQRFRFLGQYDYFVFIQNIFGRCVNVLLKAEETDICFLLSRNHPQTSRLVFVDIARFYCI